METQREVRNAIRLNDWAFSLDLTDVYLHVRIHPQSRKYLWFTLNGRVYHFKALPFGLLTSPFVFTLLMMVIATHLRIRAIKMHPYLELVISEPKSSKSVGTQTLHNVSYNIPRSDYQLPEIRPHSYSNFHFHKVGISNLFQHCQSSTSQSSETIGNNHDHLSEKNHISQSFPFSFGTTQCSSGLCNARRTTSPTIANVPALSMETTKIFTELPNQVISEHFTPSRLVEAGRDLSTRSALEDKSPSHTIFTDASLLG